VTLNDLERRNGHVVCVISPNSVAYVANYVKVVDLVGLNDRVKSADFILRKVHQLSTTSDALCSSR